MDSLAAQATAIIKPGMTATEATNALEALGLNHSAVITTENEQGARSPETGVIYSMIQHQVQPWSIGFRNVQIRVFLNSENNVQRVEARNVFTGP